MKTKYKLVRVLETPTEQDADLTSLRRLEIEWCEENHFWGPILCPPQRALKVICPDVEIARNKRGFFSDFTDEEKASLKYPLAIGHDYFVEGTRETVAIDWHWCQINLPPHGVYSHLTYEDWLDWGKEPEIFLFEKEDGQWLRCDPKVPFLY